MKSLLILVPGLLLVGCAQHQSNEVSYGNDALPSAEVTSFETIDQRLGYANARIEYDANECAVYQGTAPDGQIRTELLRDASGQPFCH